MYRHILIPTDGSQLAERGVTHGLALAKSLGAKVSVIFVLEPFSEMTGQLRDAVARYAALRKEEATSALERAAKAAKEIGISCKTTEVENGQTPSSHHRSSRGQRLRPHRCVIARAQRTFHASNRQCDEQGADARENPRTGLSVNVRTARWVKINGPKETVGVFYKELWDHRQAPHTCHFPRPSTSKIPCEEGLHAFKQVVSP